MEYPDFVVFRPVRWANSGCTNWNARRPGQVTFALGQVGLGPNLVPGKSLKKKKIPLTIFVLNISLNFNVVYKSSTSVIPCICVCVLTCFSSEIICVGHRNTIYC